MTTDRELLELAAKAAGLPGSWGDKINYHNGVVDLTDYWVLEEEEFYIWSPLTDDGDALRLAVKLGIDISTLKGEKGIIYAQATTWDEHGRCQDFDTYEHGDDKYAATRRAIVGCAAVIGRNTP